MNYYKEKSFYEIFPVGGFLPNILKDCAILKSTFVAPFCADFFTAHPNTTSSRKTILKLFFLYSCCTHLISVLVYVVTSILSAIHKLLQSDEVQCVFDLFDINNEGTVFSTLLSLFSYASFW